MINTAIRVSSLGTEYLMKKSAFRTGSLAIMIFIVSKKLRCYIPGG